MDPVVYSAAAAGSQRGARPLKAGMLLNSVGMLLLLLTAGVRSDDDNFVMVDDGNYPCTCKKKWKHDLMCGDTGNLAYCPEETVLFHLLEADQLLALRVG